MAQSDGLSWTDKHANYVNPSQAELKKILSELQYDVTQKDSTERPFQNEYWNNKKAGIYVDIVSGEPLFSSKDKFKSGTGWPSFTRPIVTNALVEKADFSIFGIRTELRSTLADSQHPLACVTVSTRPRSNLSQKKCLLPRVMVNLSPYLVDNTNIIL